MGRLTQQPNEWEHYQFPPSFVLGFHGCDQSTGEAILSGEVEHLLPSQNDYDWLGHGIYFWEGNVQRAQLFAEERAAGRPVSRGEIRKPFVLGAVINLGLCLDLNDSSALREVQRAHTDFCALFEESGLQIPKNRHNMKVRNLDCAVFNYLHGKREILRPPSTPYDSIRCAYREGDPIYAGTDICQENHTQICVRSTSSILGYFRPIKR